MIFEITPPAQGTLYQVLQPAVGLWGSSEPSSAMVYIEKHFRRPKKGAGGQADFTEQDWHFSIAVASGCGLFEHSKLLTTRAREKHPDSPMLNLMYAWDLSVNGKFFECRELVEQMQSTLPQEHLPLVASMDCYNYSISGWRKSAEAAHERAIEQVGNEPFPLYVLARAAARRSRWELSAYLSRRVVELAPTWSRARAAAMDSLLAQGSVAEVRELMETTPENALPFFSLDMSNSLFHQVSGDLASAVAAFRKSLQRWPFRSRAQRFTTYQLAMLLLETGDDEAAASLIAEHRLRRLNVKRTVNESRQRYISLRLVSQNHNHCVPTVAAMAASAQGVDASPIEYATGMNTRNGTPMWRMIDYMINEGFHAVCIQATIPAIQTMLDNGVPLIGSMNGLFNSHVDVICGYDAGLQLVHLRDPMHWFGRPLSYESVPKKYCDGEGLWALIKSDNQAAINAAAEHHYVIGEAIVDLARACSSGDRIAAEQAYALIPDDHPLAMTRDSYAQSVVITPQKFEERLQAFAEGNASRGVRRGIRD